MAPAAVVICFPLVLEQHLEVAHVPLRGVGFPGAFKTAGGGVAALAAAVLLIQPKPISSIGAPSGSGPTSSAGPRAVHLAEGVAAGHQGHGLVVVHGHAGEGLAHVACPRHRVGVAVRALRVHVDQAHLHGGQRVFQIALAAVAAVGLVAGGQPLLLGAPVDVFFRRPDVRAATGKAEGLEAHGLHGHVAAQDEQVGPGNGVAVFLLDGPQQAAALVEVAVVGPAVERRKALVAGVGAAAAVGRAVGAGACQARRMNRPP
jgi:hypothetical protein